MSFDLCKIKTISYYYDSEWFACNWNVDELKNCKDKIL